MCCMEWITDRVPLHTEFCLVVVDEEVWPAYYDRSNSEWVFNDGAPARTVDAWMEMPKYVR